LLDLGPQSLGQRVAKVECREQHGSGAELVCFSVQARMRFEKAFELCIFGASEARGRALEQQLVDPA
jgi:hypothetical protein